MLVKVISWLCWSRTPAFSNGAMKVKSKQSCLNYITHNEIIMRSIGCRIFLALKAFNEVQRHIVLFCFGSHFLLNTQTQVCVNKETLQAGSLKHLIVLHVLAGYSQDYCLSLFFVLLVTETTTQSHPVTQTEMTRAT